MKARTATIHFTDWSARCHSGHGTRCGKRLHHTKGPGFSTVRKVVNCQRCLALMEADAERLDG